MLKQVLPLEHDHWGIMLCRVVLCTHDQHHYQAMPQHQVCLLCIICAGKNPFEGFTPEVPDGKRLDYGSKEFSDLENIGAPLPAVLLHAGRHDALPC